MKRVVLEHSAETVYAHSVEYCQGMSCALHRRTPHAMRSFPQHWRADRGIIERVCPHGIGHPDPDDLRITRGHDNGMHGCDGCCRKGLPDA